jgi:hypothetical protein
MNSAVPLNGLGVDKVSGRKIRMNRHAPAATVLNPSHTCSVTLSVTASEKVGKSQSVSQSRPLIVIMMARRRYVCVVDEM